jgi:hypothetical protein
MDIVDIKQMPGFNPTVQNGIESVSKAKVIWTDTNLVTCLEHGAMLCISENRRLWRCPTCNEGAYVRSFSLGKEERA